MTHAPTRPIVRYHGGKWKLAPWIISHFPEHRVYTEAFGGGGSVLLRKPRSYAEVYNDLDGEIVNLFRVVRDHGEELRRRVELTPFARDEFDGSYESADDHVEQARRTLVRAGMSYASTGASSRWKTGFRWDAGRQGSTAAMDWVRAADNLEAVIERLRGVTIENVDGLEILKRYDNPTTLHYVDPPYVSITRTHHQGKGGYKHEYTDGDHEKLAETLHSLKGAVVLSGYHSDLYDHLFSDWERVEVQTTAASSSGAIPRTEVLWMRGGRRHQELFEDLQ